MIKARLFFLASTGATLLTGCNGAVWGNLVVLAISVGIFMGTLSLGKNTSAGDRKGKRSFK